MGRQRNIPQMKEKKKSPEKQRKKMEAINLPHTEFKIIVIRILEELSENFTKETERVKRTEKP